MGYDWRTYSVYDKKTKTFTPKPKSTPSSSTSQTPSSTETTTIPVSQAFKEKYERAIERGEKPSQPVRLTAVKDEPTVKEKISSGYQKLKSGAKDIYWGVTGTIGGATSYTGLETYETPTEFEGRLKKSKADVGGAFSPQRIKRGVAFAKETRQLTTETEIEKQKQASLIKESQAEIYRSPTYETAMREQRILKERGVDVQVGKDTITYSGSELGRIKSAIGTKKIVEGIGKYSPVREWLPSPESKFTKALTSKATPSIIKEVSRPAILGFMTGTALGATGIYPRIAVAGSRLASILPTSVVTIGKITPSALGIGAIAISSYSGYKEYEQYNLGKVGAVIGGAKATAGIAGFVGGIALGTEMYYAGVRKAMSQPETKIEYDYGEKRAGQPYKRRTIYKTEFGDRFTLESDVRIATQKVGTKGRVYSDIDIRSKWLPRGVESKLFGAEPAGYSRASISRGGAFQYEPVQAGKGLSAKGYLKLVTATEGGTYVQSFQYTTTSTKAKVLPTPKEIGLYQGGLGEAGYVYTPYIRTSEYSFISSMQPLEAPVKVNVVPRIIGGGGFKQPDPSKSKYFIGQTTQFDLPADEYITTTKGKSIKYSTLKDVFPEYRGAFSVSKSTTPKSQASYWNNLIKQSSVKPITTTAPSITSTETLTYTQTVPTIIQPSLAVTNIGALKTGLKASIGVASLLGAGIKSASAIKQKSIVSPIYKQSERILRRQDIISTPKIAITPKISEASLVTPLSAVGSRSATRTVTTTAPSLPTPTFTTPTGIIPFASLGFALPFKLPDFNFPSATRKRRKLTGKQPKRYTPSYWAVVKQIRGKKPKGTETGVRLRPITKGFKWSRLRRL